MDTLGLMFYQARFYDPSLGRFAQADSIVPGGVQGLDRYAYVNNSPINNNDPTGHWCVYVGAGSYAAGQQGVVGSMICNDLPGPFAPVTYVVSSPTGSVSVFHQGGTSYQISSAGAQAAYYQNYATRAVDAGTENIINPGEYSASGSSAFTKWNGKADDFGWTEGQSTLDDLLLAKPPDWKPWGKEIYNNQEYMTTTGPAGSQFRVKISADGTVIQTRSTIPVQPTDPGVIVGVPKQVQGANAYTHDNQTWANYNNSGYLVDHWYAHSTFSTQVSRFFELLTDLNFINSIIH
jgi:RHS repeat-associated protein